MRKNISILAAGLLVFAVCGCAGKKTAEKPAARPAPAIGKVLIAETFTNLNYICRLCLRPVHHCSIDQGSDGSFQSALTAAFADQGFEIAKGKISLPAATDKERISRYVELAQRLNAKYFVLPGLYCWGERRGSDLSASKPAEVGFHLHFYESQTGKEIWAGNFYEQQQALSENILDLGEFVKRGGKWVTAEKLAKDGAARLITKFLETIAQNAANPGH